MTEQLGWKAGKSKPHCPDIDIIGKLAMSLASSLYSVYYLLVYFRNSFLCLVLGDKNYESSYRTIACDTSGCLLTTKQ